MATTNLGGYLYPEICLKVQLDLAKDLGAELHTNEKVLEYQSTDKNVVVTTNLATYSADQLIIAAGPWNKAMLDPRVAQYLKVFRQTLYWFELGNAPELFDPQQCPVFIWNFTDQFDSYGFPAMAGPLGGVKIATELYDTPIDPNHLDSLVNAEEKQTMFERYVKHKLPGLTSNCLRAVTCLYTTTLDFDFILDRHPDY